MAYSRSLVLAAARLRLQQVRHLLLAPLDLRPQVVLRVTLRNVLNEGAVGGQEKARDVDGFRVPQFAVFNRELLRVEDGQETQLCPNAKVRHDDVQRFVQQCVLADLREHKVREVVCGERPVVEFVETDCLQVHDISDIESLNPIVFVARL